MNGQAECSPGRPYQGRALDQSWPAGAAGQPPTRVSSLLWQLYQGCGTDARGGGWQRAVTSGGVPGLADVSWGGSP
jgi:hypothetical protein